MRNSMDLAAVMLWLAVLAALAARGAAQAATAQPVGKSTVVPSAAPTSSPTTRLQSNATQPGANGALVNEVNTAAVGAGIGALVFVAGVGVAVVRRSQRLGAVADQEASKTSSRSGQSLSGGSLADRPLASGSVAGSVAGSGYGGGASSGRDPSIYLPRRAGAAGPGAAAPASSALAMAALATSMKRGRATLQRGVRAMPTDEFFSMFVARPGSSAEVMPARASPEPPARANKVSPSPMRTSPAMARASPLMAPVSSRSPAAARPNPSGPVPGIQPKLRITAIDLDSARGKDLASYL
jgi:hypothetical protein